MASGGQALSGGDYWPEAAHLYGSLQGTFFSTSASAAESAWKTYGLADT
jgi:hypothetical protein